MYNLHFFKQLFKPLFLLTALVLGSSLALPVVVFAGGEAADEALVVSILPKQVPAILGKTPDPYSLFAVKDGKFKPIPYQFDEIRESGFVYMRENSKKVKKKDPITGKEGLFDGEDELLFMLKDAGQRKSNFMKADGKIVAEIAVDNYKGKKRYVYLVEGSVLEAEDHYVRFSSALGRVETDYYALKVDPKNAFMWEEFYYDSFVGENPGRPFDTITLRMSSNALALIPLNMNNKHMIAKVVAEKSGPIRSTTEYKVVLTYLKSPIMNFTLQIVHHEQGISYNSRVFIPAIRRRMVSKAAMNASVDGYNLYGAEVYASSGPRQPGIVDGAISKVEEEMLKSKFQTNVPAWLFLKTSEGFSFMNHFVIDTDEEIPMGVVYEENKEKSMKPEYYKGQMPMIGFMMERTPLKGFMQVTNATHMFSKEIEMEVHDFAELVVREPKIEVVNF
jgi:hypothetical protein